MGRGAEVERLASGSAGLVVFAVGSISPWAVEILLVKDEMAHPAQELSLGVPTRGSDLWVSVGTEGGITVSAIVPANFRTRRT